MTENLDRRDFLKGSLAASAGLTLGVGREEQILLAQLEKPADESKPASPAPVAEMPKGKIGDVEFSRLICGGNLIGGWAHSRDLIYVSKLFKAYNTDEKIMDTLQLCEEHGVNAILTNPVSSPVINRYWRERGGSIQWISEGHPQPGDMTEVKKVIDSGAAAVYLQGGIGDRWIGNKQTDTIGEMVEFIKRNGLPAGVGAHMLEVPMTCEQAGLGADFYVKTLHHGDYWSARRDDQTQQVIANPADNFWCVNPEKTIEYMAALEKPWIAFKVLAAGAIPPRDGFQYAFDNGADFICVGMFDFQIAEDAQIARETIAKVQRQRPWRA
jgi:hypothetical protein